jgi:hypothetical protein
MTALLIGVALGGILLGFLLLGERGRLVLPASRKMLRELNGRQIFSLHALHAYIYGRWTAQYVSFFLNYVPGFYRVMLTKLLPDRYHAKVLTHDHATAIITLNKDIPLRDLEQVIPYPKARKLVLQAPPEVAVYECPCRHARPDPCLPTQVCMVIGQPFVDFILEHHPKTSRKITQAEALEILAGEHERGHVHTAWFKEDCLGRFYAICNCCKCCCGGIEVMRGDGAPIFASSGYVSVCRQFDSAPRHLFLY